MIFSFFLFFLSATASPTVPIEFLWPRLGETVVRSLQSTVPVRLRLDLSSQNCFGVTQPSLSWDEDGELVLRNHEDWQNITLPIKCHSGERALNVYLNGCGDTVSAETFFKVAELIIVTHPSPGQMFLDPSDSRVNIKLGLFQFQDSGNAMGKLRVEIDEVPWASEPISGTHLSIPLFLPLPAGPHTLRLSLPASEHFDEFDIQIPFALQNDWRRRDGGSLEERGGGETSVCVCFLSCLRIGFLLDAAYAFVEYARRVEPELKFKLLLADNGSGGPAQTLLENLFRFDFTAYFRRNRGIAHGLNVLFFGLCDSPYILSLEDDWRARDRWRTSLPLIQQAIEVLEEDNMVLEVHLRDFQNRHDYAHNRSQWLTTGGGVRYRRQCHNRLAVGHMSAHGTYTNGASLKRRLSLISVGKFRADGEYEYSERVNSAGFCSAHICLESDPGRCGVSGMYGTGEEDYIGLFEHIGRGSTSGFSDFNFLEESVRAERFRKRDEL